VRKACPIEVSENSGARRQTRNVRTMKSKLSIHDSLPRIHAIKRRFGDFVAI
jgi:hypothetical protein